MPFLMFFHSFTIKAVDVGRQLFKVGRVVLHDKINPPHVRRSENGFVAGNPAGDIFFAVAAHPHPRDARFRRGLKQNGDDRIAEQRAQPVKSARIEHDDFVHINVAFPASVIVTVVKVVSTNSSASSNALNSSTVTK